MCSLGKRCRLQINGDVQAKEHAKCDRRQPQALNGEIIGQRRRAGGPAIHHAQRQMAKDQRHKGHEGKEGDGFSQSNEVSEERNVRTSGIEHIPGIRKYLAGSYRLEV